VEIIVDNPSPALRLKRTGLSQQDRSATSVNTIALLLWLVAGTVAFLPFAFDTSAWDAVTLRVPGNQGNWWHFLAGAPFFLAFPMIWLRLRSLFSSQPSTAIGRRLLWVPITLSMLGTAAVEAPFLLHLSGTSDWQRFIVLGLGFGIMIASTAILVLRRRSISPHRACLAGIDTAYLANMALCLVVYAGSPGNLTSKSAWFVSIVIFWPILIELMWLLFKTLQPTSTTPSPFNTTP